MIRFKRSRFFVVVFEDEPVFDLGTFLRGRVDLAHEPRIQAISALTDSAHRLTGAELELLAKVSAHEWSPASQLAAEHGMPEETLDDLAVRGLLVSDADDGEPTRLRRREERFESCQWHPCAAFYNQMIKYPWDRERDRQRVLDMASMTAASRDVADRFVARHGPPPPPFHQVAGDGAGVRLPRIEKQGGLYRALANRKTVRAFDTARPMRLEDLATVLYYVFGCHGYTSLTQGVYLLKKTSPSGGSLHPIEVYPMVLNVAGAAPGLYHYAVGDHALTRIRPLEDWEAESLAVGMAAGHGFASSAHVLLLMTARFNRNFWKYRRSVKTHSVVLQDAGHLSQTLYLVCSDLGLGSFYAAFDAFFIEEALGLDGVEEGAVGLAGIGERLAGGMDYSLEFTPYTPGETEL